MADAGIRDIWSISPVDRGRGHTKRSGHCLAKAFVIDSIGVGESPVDVENNQTRLMHD